MIKMCPVFIVAQFGAQDTFVKNDPPFDPTGDDGNLREVETLAEVAEADKSFETAVEADALAVCR